MFCTLLMYVCGESVCLLKTEMVQKCDKTDFQTGVGEEDFQMFQEESHPKSYSWFKGTSSELVMCGTDK